VKAGLHYRNKNEKIKKSIFSIDKANFSQLVLLDKFVIGQDYNENDIFWNATLYRKIERKFSFGLG
jgi:hypothetical protein